MRALAPLTVLALTLPVLAGCLAPNAEDAPRSAAADDGVPRVALAHFDASLPAPRLLCHETANGTGEASETPSEAEPRPGRRCNFEMTPDEGRQGNEVTIAVNPLDPKNVVGGAKDYYPPDAGECVWDGVYVTHDGGATPYEDRSFDGSPWRQLNEPDPSKLNYASQFWCTTDPVAYFDLAGNLYYVLMAYQADRVTGSKTCEAECPNGALNDWAFNRAVQIVAISDDGGDTFHTFTPVLDGTFPVAFHDKAWIAAQNDGSAIHIMWLSFLAGGQMYFRSTDGGKTYTEMQQFATLATGAGQGSFLDVGPGDEVYASWANGDDVTLVRSADKGATWDAPRAVVKMKSSQIDNGLSPRDRRDGFPALAVDKFVDSPFAGAVYFTWSDSRDEGDVSNIYFAASFDGGETFTEPLRISDDATTAPQMMPAVSVSPGGVIDVTWMDQRRDAENQLLIDQYYTYSLDGGKTWAPNFRVRDVADAGGWDPSLSHHQNGMVFIGDYIDIDSSWAAAHPVWPDTRSGTVVDVYTATIERPMFAVGFDAAKKAAAMAWTRDHPLS